MIREKKTRYPVGANHFRRLPDGASEKSQKAEKEPAGADPAGL
jgi:hypothetical protein